MLIRHLPALSFAVMLSVVSVCNRTRHWFPLPQEAV